MTREPERIAQKPFWFRLVTRVSGVAVATENPSTLKYPGEDCISIAFRQPLESELPVETTNHPQYETPAIFDCVGTATMRHAVPRKVRKALLENEIKLQWIPQIDDHIWDVPEALKRSLDPFMRSIHEKLTEALHATYRILRWRHALGGTVKPFSSARLEWSPTGRKWTELPGPSAPVWIDWNFRTLSFSADEADEAKTFLRNGTQEPVAHELFREAWDQCAESPRAALVIGMAAAEIGVKDFIAQRVPEAGWLMKEAAAQDWIKLLSDYLPTLLREASLRFVSGMDEQTHKDPVIRSLRNGVTLRNAVVHRADQQPLSQKKVRNVLLAVRDVLYLLDYYASHKWALDWISVEAQEAWQGADIAK